MNLAQLTRDAADALRYINAMEKQLAALRSLVSSIGEAIVDEQDRRRVTAKDTPAEQIVEAWPDWKRNALGALPPIRNEAIADLKRPAFKRDWSCPRCERSHVIWEDSIAHCDNCGRTNLTAFNEPYEPRDKDHQ